MKLSVLICTYNPRMPYLQRVLDALKAQTLPQEQWELLLIDNASIHPLVQSVDLSGHPNARHVREDKPGKTFALLRGVLESTGEIVVIVDDDNVLQADYLEKAIDLFNHWPMLGAIGAGVIRGEFEIPLPQWITPFLPNMAINEMDRDYWSNFYEWEPSAPYGAGGCYRRCVANDYAQKVMNTPLRKLLGRSGTSMIPGDDNDFGFCAVDLGMGMGRFVSLKLTHLVPKERLTEDYIVRLSAGIAGSDEVLAALRKEHLPPRPPLWKRKIRFLIEYCKKGGRARRILVARERIRDQVRKQIAELSST